MSLSSEDKEVGASISSVCSNNPTLGSNAMLDTTAPKDCFPKNISLSFSLFVLIFFKDAPVNISVTMSLKNNLANLFCPANLNIPCTAFAPSRFVTPSIIPPIICAPDNEAPTSFIPFDMVNMY